MNWNKYEELSHKWTKVVEASSESQNRFMKSTDEIKECEECSFELTDDVIALLKKANESGEVVTFRRMFPPSHDLFFSKLDQLENVICNVVLTDDNTIIFRTGKETEKGCLYYIKENQLKAIEDAEFAGISRDKQYISIAYEKGIYLYSKEGKQIETFTWPSQAEKNPKVYQVKHLVPFCDGQKIMLVTDAGIFVLDVDGRSRLIHPIDQNIGYLNMVHGDVSPRENFIVVGDQDSEHIVLDVEEGYEESEVVDRVMEYADFALFNGDGSYVIMNSCQMYDGASVILGMDTDDITDVELSARFTAGASCSKCFIVGDIDGNIYSINTDGTWNWCYYVGSTIKGIDISKDGRTLVVGTCAGMLHLLRLEYENDRITVKNITESKRYIAWKGENAIYEW